MFVPPPDSNLLPRRMPLEYFPVMAEYYSFKRGDRVVIISGHFSGMTGVVDSAVFQRSFDNPKEYVPGYHVILDFERVVTLRRDQLAFESNG